MRLEQEPTLAIPKKMMTENCRKWGDWMLEEDERRSERLMRMPNVHWTAYAKKAIASKRGDIRPLLKWLDAMEVKRAEFRSRIPGIPVVRDMSSDAMLFRIWKDMILEPAKYGDSDWDEWLVINEHLTHSLKRWRLAAFWQELQDKEDERMRGVYARRIQALWRGHRVRNTQEGLSCENCLAHTISPKRWSGKHLCNGCWSDVQTDGCSSLRPVVPKSYIPVWPVQPDEHGCMPCDGCGRVVVDEGDFGEYAPGYWCSRRCAYD